MYNISTVPGRLQKPNVTITYTTEDIPHVKVTFRVSFIDYALSNYFAIILALKSNHLSRNINSSVT